MAFRACASVFRWSMAHSTLPVPRTMARSSLLKFQFEPTPHPKTITQPTRKGFPMAKALQIKIVVAEDHHLVRKGLKSLLDSEASFDLVGEAGDGLEALQVT